ncbi:hypothetical protein [Xanthomonas sacchari]|uniref:Adenylate kinase n=1 Tax=Xanthomonas sacchari TaxID=56458 RepID=A0A2P5Z8I1_9XANT|nr:hypothetical protein [Xanthomonas sacchari]PPU84815.1 hypothetical protein XsacCFBP4641_03210 [Xanthomonas sacchari]
MRIFITGPTGAGKTTLARRLGCRHGIACHALDDLHWVRCPEGDVRRPLEEKLPLLQHIVDGECWIVEGVQFKWADPALARADHIVVIDAPSWRTTLQIVLRLGRQWLGLEAAAYRPTLARLPQMLAWSRNYHREERALLLAKLAPFRARTLLIRHSRVRLPPPLD